jgi:hypothetical protein
LEIFETIICNGDSARMIDQDMAGAQDTIYLCNFRVSVDGEWLCLKELQDVEFSVPESSSQPSTPSPDEPLPLLGMLARNVCAYYMKFICV